MLLQYWYRQLTIVSWLIGELALVISHTREIVSDTHREEPTKRPSNLRSLKALEHLTVSASVDGLLQQDQTSYFCPLIPSSA